MSDRNFSSGTFTVPPTTPNAIVRQVKRKKGTRETNGAKDSPKPFLVLDWEAHGRWRVDQSHWPILLLRIRRLQATELYAE